MTFEEWWDKEYFNRKELQELDPVTKGWLHGWCRYAWESRYSTLTYRDL